MPELRFLNSTPRDILDQIVLCLGGVPAHCSASSSILASAYWMPEGPLAPGRDNPKGLQRRKTSPGEDSGELRA